MSAKALVIPFYRYQPQTGTYYKIYFEWLLKALTIWGNEIDHLYLIDQEWGFTVKDHQKLNALVNTTILVSSIQDHHWAQFKWAIPQITEDTILFMDNDVLIWEKGIVSSWFKRAETADIVAPFDGSGGLRELVQARYPFLKEHGVTRMGTYYFLLHKSAFDLVPDFDFAPIQYKQGTYIKELDYTTKEGDWSDSFGLFTIKYFAHDPKIDFMYDEWATLWFDGETITTQGTPTVGYYHIRNGNMPIYALSSKLNQNHVQFFWKTVNDVPRRELLRQFAWFYVLSTILNLQENIQQTLAVMEELKIDKGKWLEYIDRFRTFHAI